MKRIAIIGASGYTGLELITLLIRHSNVSITHITSESSAGTPLCDVHPRLRGSLPHLCFERYNWDAMKDTTDVVFLALPHGVAMQYVPPMLSDGKIVIDVSSDFRLKDAAEYTQWYKVPHTAQKLLAYAVYGLSELFRNDIRTAQLIANPGCYATATILALFPLIKATVIDTSTIVVDAKSGVSGAGKKQELMYLFNEANENLTPYSVGKHRHTPEIEQIISTATPNTTQRIGITFVPHLIPMTRGIIATCYARIREGIDVQTVHAAYTSLYKNEQFVHVLPIGQFPSVKDVVHTNACHIGITLVPNTNTVIVVSAIDNLVKGASGQAIQNMNIICGFDENEGLK